ncbi:ankyrin repeat-containing protein [Stemphylium lycopersici]|uniref:Ankyrin repeat-containing protein n=1 Tax=Stemphylium lycopersici TaxID=183478 RepID=A0A364MVX2_STELY|nr:ankyrin repeat-containing protein [Stemphylium lycopersici]RAR00277.1 ankyrin repeat-containing protein [Stemphylium lycopersici]RAR05168.1 ankyrin repeat-containing protein [Stemphylium lycopersici]
MSLIVSSAARLKPEIRLAEAVSQFEASLSADQKAAFRADRFRMLGSPPDTSSTIHPSFDAFLLATKFGTNSQTADPENNLKIAEDLMSSIISTYLSYGVFGTELSIRTPALDVSSAPANIIRSMPSDTRGVREIALRLLKSRSKRSVNMSASISETRQISRSLSREDFHLYRYAKMFALQYLSEYPDQPKDTLWAIHQLAKRDEVIATTPREVFTLFWLARQVDDIDWAWGHFQQKDPHRAYNPFSLSTIDTQALERSSSGTLSDWSQVIRFAIDHDDSRILYELLNHCKGHMHTTRQPENSKLIFNPPTHEPSYFDTFGFERDRSVTVDMRRYMFGPAPLLYAVEKWRSRSLRILLVSGMIDLEDGQAFHAPTTLALSNKNWDSVQILITASKRYPWHKEIKDLAKAEMARNEISEEIIKSVMGPDLIEGRRARAAFDK